MRSDSENSSAGKVTGKVYLVGGGPGDPDLISLKGLRCLQQADFILYDGLVNPLILRHTKAVAERTARADAAGQRILQQEQINQRLIAEARLGKTVVRLKGGDPYIFGRGSEEAEALRAAGIEYEVVPGITAATAAAEYAGFSLTHRDHASAVCLITGHEDPTKPASSLDYETLARFSGTLVFYMGLHRVGKICEQLIQAGMSAETAAAVITKASTTSQKVVTGTLNTLAEQVEQAQLHPPSLIVVGECVRLREQIQWFEQKPLFGCKVGITRAVEQAEPQIQQLLELGAEPILMPLIEIDPVPFSLEIAERFEQLKTCEWIVWTSANAVEHFFRLLQQAGKDLRYISHLKFACVGAATANRLKDFYLQADLIPETSNSETLAESLLEAGCGGPVFWPQADRARETLRQALTKAGIELIELIVYEHRNVTTLPAYAAHVMRVGELDWIGLSSPAIAGQLANLLTTAQLDQIRQSTRLVAISSLTAVAAQEAGFEQVLIAETASWDGIIQTILHQRQVRGT